MPYQDYDSLFCHEVHKELYRVGWIRLIDKFCNLAVLTLYVQNKLIMTM